MSVGAGLQAQTVWLRRSLLLLVTSRMLCDCFWMSEEEVSFGLRMMWGQAKEAEESAGAWRPKSPRFSEIFRMEMRG